MSDDFDLYTNRTFSVVGGVVDEYTGTHAFDIDLRHNIRLAPFYDTANPGGGYILAICSLADGYPVEPRDCKYDFLTVSTK